MRQEKVTLPGRKRHYVIAGGAIAFIGLSALYFAAIAYVGAPLQPTCWLPFVLLPTLFVGIGTSLQLRYATFEETDD